MFSQLSRLYNPLCFSSLLSLVLHKLKNIMEYSLTISLSSSYISPHFWHDFHLIQDMFSTGFFVFLSTIAVGTASPIREVSTSGYKSARNSSFNCLSRSYEEDTDSSLSVPVLSLEHREMIAMIRDFKQLKIFQKRAGSVVINIGGESINLSLIYFKSHISN